MTKLAPEWIRTSDPVIRSPARYRWTTAPAHYPEEVIQDRTEYLGYIYFFIIPHLYSTLFKNKIMFKRALQSTIK